MFILKILRYLHKQDHDQEFWHTCQMVLKGDVAGLQERLGIHPHHLNQKTRGYQENSFQFSLLFLAKHAEMINYLISQGMQVNDVDQYGNTPLHYAALDGRKETITTLLNHHADCKIENKWGQTPLQLATTPATVMLLTDLVPELLDPSFYDVNIYDAAKTGKEEVIRFLLSAGVNPNLLNHEDYYLDDWYSTPLRNAVYIGYARIAELLLQHGANPNARKGVALYREAYNEACVRLLHKYGATATQENWDAAYWEAVVNVASSTVLQALIELGESPSRNLLHECIRRVDQTTAEHPKIAKILVGLRPEWLHELSKIDESPLQKAVDQCNHVMVRALIELGADVNQQNSKGQTPLHQAVKRRDQQTISYLITNGTDVTIKDDWGLSAYEWAQLYRNQTICDLIQDQLNVQNQPIPPVYLPPFIQDEQSPLLQIQDQSIHYFWEDSWNDAVFIRWDRERFLKVAKQWGFTRLFYISYECTVPDMKFFFLRDQKLILDEITRNDEMIVTQYIAFHPDDPTAWITLINWWNSDSEVDYNHFHGRCSSDLANEIEQYRIDTEIARFTLEESRQDELVEPLFYYGNIYLRKGLENLKELPFYQGRQS